MPTTCNKPLVIITGCAGKLGVELVAALQDSYTVVGFDKDKETCDIPCDITSESSLATAFELFKLKYGKKIAAVIHLAAYFDFSGEQSPLYETVNVQGTKNLLNALQDFDVERFIYTSTMLVHKPCKPGETINEESPLKAKWAYPQSKIDTEAVIAQHHGKIPYLIIRIAGLYDDLSCVPTLAHQIARIYERDIKGQLYAGDVNAGQAFIHQNDLNNLFKKALEKRGELPFEDIILAGEPTTYSYEKLHNQIAQLVHGEPIELQSIPSGLANAGAWLEEQSEPLIPDDFDQGEKPFIRPFMIDLASDHYALDITKARNELGWEPRNSIEKKLPVIIESLKADPVNWYEKNGLIKPDWMTPLHDINPEKIRKQYETSYRKQHQNYLWAHFLNIGFGFWLLTSPATLGYESYPLVVSDMISGILLIFLAFLSLSWRLAPARLGCASIGLWLIFAPLIFWAPTAAAYLNDTLVGSLVIGFAVLVRPAVGVAPNAAMHGSVKPPGWDFSPSTWSQRLPIIILAYIGLFISRYMAAYQLGHIDRVWDPFFIGSLVDAKNGTEEIITSYVSHAFPVPDAGLGAAVYILEILTGIIGGSRRWRTMPWLVLLFGIMIIPLGVVSITFIVIQPILLNTWCTLCLIAAVAMLVQVPYSFDELIATSVFLWRRYKAGRPLLRILFVGDSDGSSKNKTDEDYFEQSPGAVINEMLRGGITLPWNLIVCLLIGVWLLFTRIMLDASGSMANADHLIGSLIITVSVTSFAETARVLRFINILFGMALLITPFVYGAGILATIVSLISGILLCALSIPRGKIKASYGSWDKFIV